MKGLRLILFPYPYPKILVLEVGADRPGDIARLTNWLKPDMVAVTRIGEVPVHVEFFKNRNELIEEKSHLVRALKPGGTLILNGDDPDVLKFKDLFHAKTIIVSVGGEGDIVASHDSILYESHIPIGMTCKLSYDGHVVPLTKKGVLGMHQIYPMLTAVGAAVSMGVNIVTATQAFEHEVPTPGRMRIFRGVKDTVVIDDSYNASPVAVEAALRTLKEVKTKGRKIAVLGDMLELGKHSRDEHVAMGKLAAKCADIVVTVGVRARSYAEGALQGGMNDLAVMQYEYSREAGKCVEVMLLPGDVVLVKGSQGLRMEHVVKEIMAEPEKAASYLVRQDVEWQDR